MFSRMLAAAVLTTTAVHGVDEGAFEVGGAGGVNVEATSRVNVQVTQADGAAVEGARTLTWLHDGSPAWPDLPRASFDYVPAHLIGAALVVPERILEGGSVVRFWCPSYGVGLACDVYVLIFECSPCESQKGTLAENLLGNGWERTRCAPKFKTGAPGGAWHLMSSYRKSLGAGEELRVRTDSYAPTEWTAFAIKGYSLECDLFDTPKACNEELNFCEWKGYECVVNTCITPGPAYRVGCSACPNDEDSYGRGIASR